MLNIYNQNREKLAVLHNAMEAVEYERLNSVSELTFRLPATDEKNAFCQPFHLLRWDDGQLYRLLDSDREMQGGTDMASYSAEHVIATLIDDVIFGTWEQLNLPTRTVLENILARQTTRNWVLGDCDFIRQFSYSWSNENLLAALFSIPNRLEEEYHWVFDTRSWPWVVHLKRLDQTIDPQYYIREQRNLLSGMASSRGRMIYNRIYALGYGEGVNQLTLRDVNGGVPYVEDKASIAKYGLHTTIWEDLRFEDPASLLQRARVLLKGYAHPYETCEVTAADLEKLTGMAIDRAEAGKIVQFGDRKTYVVEVERHLQAEGMDRISIANAPEDIAGTIADLADRSRVTSVYANGATNLYAQQFSDNADAGHPAALRFYVPSEARQINKVILTWTRERFRAYETGAESTETTSRSTDGGGGGTNTSASGGGGATTSASSGGESKTSGPSSRWSTGQNSDIHIEDGGTGLQVNVWDNKKMNPEDLTKWDHAHVIQNIGLPSHDHGMDHTHTFSTTDHSHSVKTPEHTHAVSIPNHSHSFTIPGHTHKIVHGIYEGPRADAVRVLVDGVAIPLADGQTEVDVANYLAVESGSGKIRRGTYHTIEIVPLPTASNPQALTRISATVTVQLFIQSAGGGNY